MFSHAAHTHARSHVVATYYTTILLNRAGLRSVAASRDACKGATIDWYSFRGRLYPRTFSRSFVTRRNRGGHRNVPSIRPTSDALHAPLSLPSFSILRAHVRLANTSAVFPFYTRWKNARAFSLFLSLYLSLRSNSPSLQETDTSLFQSSKPEFLLDRIWLLLLLLLLLPDDAFVLLCERFKMRFSRYFFLEVS